MLKQRAMQNSLGAQLPHGNGEARGGGEAREKEKQQSGSELLK